MSELSYVHQMKPITPNEPGTVSHVSQQQHAEMQAKLHAWESEARNLTLAKSEHGAKVAALETEVRNLTLAKSEHAAKVAALETEARNLSLANAEHARAKEEEVQRLETRVRTSEAGHTTQMSRTAEEARRWKVAHDEMHASARELAYKVTVGNDRLQEQAAKHKNLQENHCAMQAKYQSLKKTLREMQEASEGSQAAKPEADQLHASVGKWKQRCHEATAKHEALSKDVLEKIREHGRAHTADQAEVAQLRADLRVSCSDNARFHKALAAAALENERTLSKLKQALRENERLTARISETEEGRSRGLRENERLAARITEAETGRSRGLRENERLSANLALAEGKSKGLEQANTQMQAQLKLSGAAVSELTSLKGELPAVKAQLQKVAALQNETDALKKARSEIQAKHAGALAEMQRAHSEATTRLQRRVDAVEEGLRTANKAISGHARQTQEMRETSDKLKAEVKTHTAALRNCHNMLENAHTVLSVCTDLHAKDPHPDTPLFAALSEATQTMAGFLRSHVLPSPPE
jgi:chromosome segregation ATPase